MCCHATKEYTDNLIKRFKRNGGKLTLYKVVNKQGNRLISLVMDKIWRPGTCRVSKKDIFNDSYIGFIRSETIYHYGLHVYTSREYARAQARNNKNKRLIRVQVELKDFIGADRNTAVFSKVTLSREEYDKVLNRKK